MLSCLFISIVGYDLHVDLWCLIWLLWFDLHVLGGFVTGWFVWVISLVGFVFVVVRAGLWVRICWCWLFVTLRLFWLTVRALCLSLMCFTGASVVFRCCFGLYC